MKPSIYIFITTEKLNFAKMSVTTLLHSHDDLFPASIVSLMKEIMIIQIIGNTVKRVILCAIKKTLLKLSSSWVDHELTWTFNEGMMD